MDPLRDLTLLGAVVTSGLMAGLYLAFGIAVMPGLRSADDHTFVTTMRAINRAILNPVFLVVFLGPLILVVVAVLTRLPDHDGLAGAGVGLLLYSATLVITAVVNVPLNNVLEAATGTPDDAVRRGFERRWTRWNHVRALLATAAFMALAVS